MATFGFPGEAEEDRGDFAEDGGEEGDDRKDHGRSYSSGCGSLTNLF